MMAPSSVLAWQAIQHDTSNMTALGLTPWCHFGCACLNSWFSADRDVAIKIVQHDTSNMAALHREANLLMSLDTPTVVQALHYATYVNTNDGTHPAHPRIADNGNTQSADLSDVDVHFVPMFGDLTCGRRSEDSTASQQQQQQQPLVPLPSLDVYVAAAAAAAAAAMVDPSLQCASSEAVQDKPAVQQAVHHAVQQAVQQPAVHKAVQPGAVQQAETHTVLEWCDAGSLAAVAEGWLREPGQRDDHMLERLVMLKDVAIGLQELHNQDAVHGNLVSHLQLVENGCAIAGDPRTVA
jgi:serine/threonine protein kinase